MTTKFKKNDQVTARTVRGSESFQGKIVKVHPGARGDWYEIKRDDNKQTFKTRAAMVEHGC